MKQSQDQDPKGEFIRGWVPELYNIPDAFIHEPWSMGPLEQEALGFKIGKDYPLPIIDHIKGAKRLLEIKYMPFERILFSLKAMQS